MLTIAMLNGISYEEFAALLYIYIEKAVAGTITSILIQKFISWEYKIHENIKHVRCGERLD